jgi:hypothetical protein
VRRIFDDERLEETYGEDMIRLLEDEDAFEWPLEDPQYCFPLGLMRDYTRRVLDKIPLDEEVNEAVLVSGAVGSDAFPSACKSFQTVF